MLGCQVHGRHASHAATNGRVERMVVPDSGTALPKTCARARLGLQSARGYKPRSMHTHPSPCTCIHLVRIQTIEQIAERFFNPGLGPPPPRRVGYPHRAGTWFANFRASKRRYGPFAGREATAVGTGNHNRVNGADCGLTSGGIQGIVVWLKASDMAGSKSKAVSLVDLGFDIHLGGRAAKAISAEVVRELTQSDLALLATERGIQPTHVQRITNRHHALARCLASGMSVTEACLCTGYTPSRVSVLRGDPSFEELIAFYQGDKAKPVLDLQERMTSLALDATAELQDRLELDPEKVSTDQLLDTIKLTADRTGNGPQTKNTNVNVNVNLGDRMKAARERASQSCLPTREASGRAVVSHETPLAPTIIDGTFTEVK